jgi:predicted DNA-binding transcriptional regulator YafY
MNFTSMRASRLLSILFEVESRPGVTAEQLSAEFGVSVRTIYRDVVALQSSGVPLYGLSGRGGGLHLVEGYRSRSSALQADEAAALLMGVVPSVADQLGLSEQRARAERKVFAQLSGASGSDVDVERSQILIDPIAWYRSPDEAPQLAAIANSLRTRTVLAIRYRRWQEPTLVRRRIEPHGIVLKAGVWYVMARSKGSTRTYRVNQIVSVKRSQVEFTPDPSFYLPTAWQEFVEQFREHLNVVTVEVRLTRSARDQLRAEGDPTVVGAIDAAVGARVDDDRPVVVALPFESHERAISEILRLGAEAQAIGPPDLVAQLAKLTAELAGRYRSVASQPPPA